MFTWVIVALGARDALQRRDRKAIKVEHREGWTDEQFDIVLAASCELGCWYLPLPSPVAAWCFWPAWARTAVVQCVSGRARRLDVNPGHRERIDSSQRTRPGTVGLLFLVATPIARVVFSVVGFIRQRDWLYVTITVAVLALLGYSLLGG